MTEPIWPRAARDTGSAIAAVSTGGGGEVVIDQMTYATWLRSSIRGWDLAFYALAAISAGSMIVVDRGVGPQTWWAIGSLAVLVAAYLLAGRRGVLSGNLLATRGYLALLIAVVCVSSGFSAEGTILLFIGYSQIWLMSASLREGALWCLALTVGVYGAALIWLRPAREDLFQIAAQLTVGLLFALALGLWTTRVSEQGQRRAALAAQLEHAQQQLAATHHTAGVLAERARVAQEIHDTLAQGFTSVVMLAQTTQAQLDHQLSAEAADRLDQIEQVARDNLAEARALVAAFGPAGLDEASLSPALTRMGERFAAETGVRVRVDLDDDGDEGLDREVQVVVLRTAQEALSNVRKHARASAVDLRLERRPGLVLLDVLDDGRGLTGAGEGVGLRGMRERVTSAGGQVRVTGAPGQGTRVRLSLPAQEQR